MNEILIITVLILLFQLFFLTTFKVFFPKIYLLFLKLLIPKDIKERLTKKGIIDKKDLKSFPPNLQRLERLLQLSTEAGVEKTDRTKTITVVLEKGNTARNNAVLIEGILQILGELKRDTEAYPKTLLTKIKADSLYYKHVKRALDDLVDGRLDQETANSLIERIAEARDKMEEDLRDLSQNFKR